MSLDGGLFTGFLEGLGKFLLKLAEGFNMVCYYIFQNGNNRVNKKRFN